MRWNTRSRFACAWLASAAVLLLAARPASAQWVTHASCNNDASAEGFRDWVVDNKLLKNGALRDKAKLDNRINGCKAVQPDNAEKDKLDRAFARVAAYVSLIKAPPVPDLGLVVDPTANPIVRMTNAAYHAKYGPGGSTTTTPPERNQLAIPSCLESADLFALLQHVNLGKTPPSSNGVQAAIDKIKALCDPGTTGKVIAAPYITGATPAIDDAPKVGDDRHGRIITWIKDTATGISHYVQFTVNANPATATPVGDQGRQQASIVNFLPGKGAHVFDWKRNNTTNRFEYDASFGNDQRCYQCHASGVLEIHPFASTDDDVGGVGDTLGTTRSDWKPWLDDLNTTWAPEIDKLNKQIRTEYHTSATGNVDQKRLSVLHGLRADVITAPEMKGYPDGMISMFNGLPNSADCLTAFNNVSTNADPTNKTKCTACHGARGAVVYDAWSEGEGFDFLMMKYVSAGHMPPVGTVYGTAPWIKPPGSVASGKVTPNTAPLLDRARLKQCYVDRLQSEVRKWLKKPT
jgi:hypothetical protein